MSKSVLQTGAGLKVYINGTDWGFVTGIQLKLGTPHKGIFGIDNPVVAELAPTLRTVSGTISVLRIVNDNGLEGRGITAPSEYYLNEPFFTITIVERQTDKVIWTARFCTVDEQDWNMAAKQIVTGSFTFQGSNWYNRSYT